LATFTLYMTSSKQPVELYSNTYNYSTQKAALTVNSKVYCNRCLGTAWKKTHKNNNFKPLDF